MKLRIVCRARLNAKFLVLVAALSLLAAGSLLAETVTLPVAASATGVGGVPFVSDVRAFNTSYTDVLTVTAVYRFNGATRVFDLAPRESRAFDDIAVSLFASPSSLGAVEFASAAPQGTLVVSSQLRSPAPSGGFVGMFIPGLPPSGASAVTALTALANGASRTNIGIYNPNRNAVTATIRLFEGEVLLGTVSVGLSGQAATQVNNIYAAAGFESLVTSNGHATVESSDPGSPLFTFAAEADNISGDLILIVGATDAPAPPGFHPPTATPTGAPAVPTGTPTPTPTPTPTAPSAVVIGLVATQFQWTFSGEGASGSILQVHVGRTYQIQIRDGDPLGTTAHGFGGISSLGLPAQTLTAGGAARTVTFTPNADQVGMNFFSCDQPSCGTGHGNMIGAIQVNP